MSKYFSTQFLSKLIFKLISIEIDVLEIFKREKEENQYLLIGEILLYIDINSDNKFLYFNKMIHIINDIHSLKYISNSLSLLAKVYYSNQEYDLAKNIFLEAEKYAKYDYSFSYPSLLENLKEVKEDNFLFTILSKIIKNSQKIKVDADRNSLFSLIFDCINLNITDLETKTNLLELSLPIANLYFHSYYKFFHYIYIGKIYARMIDKQKALIYLENSKNEALKIDLDYRRVSMLSTIALFYNELEEIQLFNELIKIIENDFLKIKSPYEKMISLSSIADSYKRMNDIEKSKDYYNEIYVILNEEKTYNNIHTILMGNLSKIYHLEDIEYFKNFIEYWINKLEKVEDSVECQLAIIDVLTILNDDLNENIFYEYFPKLIFLLKREKIGDIKVYRYIGKINNSKLKNTIIMSILEIINISDFQNSDIELIQEIYSLLLEINFAIKNLNIEGRVMIYLS
jgi:tetratricopeptide (TPR) repeat protein